MPVYTPSDVVNAEVIRFETNGKAAYIIHKHTTRDWLTNPIKATVFD